MIKTDCGHETYSAYLHPFGLICDKCHDLVTAPPEEEEETPVVAVDKTIRNLDVRTKRMDNGIYVNLSDVLYVVRRFLWMYPCRPLLTLLQSLEGGKENE